MIATDFRDYYHVYYQALSPVEFVQMALQRWREAFGSVGVGTGYQIHLKQIRFLSFSQNGPKKKIHQEEEEGDMTYMS